MMTNNTPNQQSCPVQPETQANEPVVTPDTLLKICKGKSKYSEVSPCTAGDMVAMMNDPRVREICQQLQKLSAEGADKKMIDELKGQLPVFCFNASHFKGGKRTNDAATPNGLAMMDLDHVENLEEMISSWGPTEHWKDYGIYMTHLSCTHTGVHLIIGVREGETIAQAQERVAKVMGIDKWDAACKEPSRCSYAVPQEYVIQFHKEAFLMGQTINAGSDQASVMATDAAEPQQIIAQTDGMKMDDIEEAEVIDPTPETQAEEMYEGIGLKMIAEQIVKSVLGLKTPPTEADHNRHTSYMKMQSYMRYLCDNDVKLMLKVAPDWGLPEEERLKMCQSASEYAFKQMPRQLRRMLDRIKDELDGRDSVVCHRPLPKLLPRFIRLLIKMFPEQYHRQAVQAAFPLLGTLTTGLRYKKDPYNELATTFLTFVYGPLAAGKGFTRVENEVLARPVIKQDDEALEVLQEWKDAKEAAGSGKGPKKLHLILRSVFPDFTSAALNQQIIDAQEQHLLFFTEECDDFEMNRKLSAILRKAYDGVRTGQTRVSAQSVSGGAKANINLLTCGTPMAMRKMLSNPEDGLVSRFNFVAMPDDVGFQKLKWGELTERERQELEQTIDRLYHIGLIEPVVADEQKEDLAEDAEFKQNTYDKVYIRLPRTERRIEEWIEQVQAEIDADPKKVALGRFARRVPDFMRRVAMVLYGSEGMKETNASLELMVWMGNEMLQTTLDLYGRQYEALCCEQQAESHIYQRNCKAADLYDLMDLRFTLNDLIAKRRQLGLSDSEESANTTVSRWKKRGLVRVDSLNENGERVYAKLVMEDVG